MPLQRSDEIRHRYQTDPAFRQKKLDAARNWKERNPDRVKANGAAWRARNKRRISINMSARARRLKQEMVNVYGGRCCCCGETEIEFLTLDHIFRDGTPHRLQVGPGVGTWRDAKRQGWPKERYRLLCMQCNWATRHGKECPHQLQPIAYGWCI